MSIVTERELQEEQFSPLGGLISGSPDYYSYRGERTLALFRHIGDGEYVIHQAQTARGTIFGEAEITNDPRYDGLNLKSILQLLDNS